jgi:hypothetical protein
MSTQLAPTSSRLAASAAAHGPDAVRESCHAAVASLDGELGLLLAFTSGERDAAASAAAIADAAGGAPSAGMSGKGVFAANEPVNDGCVALAFERSIECALGIAHKAAADMRECGRAATRLALDGLGEGEGTTLLIVLADTRIGDLADAIAGAYEVAGPSIPMAGGAAGGPEPAQYAGGESLTDAFVAVALRSAEGIAIGNAHTCRVVGQPSIVTRSEGQVIVEIDGRPAEEVYLENLGKGGQQMTEEEFAAVAIIHPLAQPELHGNRRLRHILGRARGGGLVCATQIPPNAGIEFTVLELDELLRSGWESVSASIEALGEKPPRAALVFDCAGRRRILGEDQEQEVRAISESFGSAAPPLAGLYTNGEVARVRGAKGDHNHAVVTVTFG